MATVQNNPLGIDKIEVIKLFGIFDYKLKVAKMNKLLLIYGDNGTGKTTIVQILFFLLSVKDGSGYKSEIAKIKFKSFKVLFQNGIEIGAKRTTHLVGSYTYYVSQNGVVVKSILFKTTTSTFEVKLEAGTPDDNSLQDIYAYISKLNITTYYLSSDRQIFNSISSSKNEQENYERQILYSQKSIIDVKKRGKNNTNAQIEKLIEYINDKIISGSIAGEKNTQAIFSDIVKNYITLSEVEVPVDAKNKMIKELEGIEAIIPSYVELGLVEKFDSKTIRNSIKKATTQEQIKFLGTVITPFLESLKAKLIALKDVEEILRHFIISINDYFTNKAISYSLKKGFILKQTNGDDIDFDWLSSGEKQLLSLLINTITSADNASLFIIDEPEISLNIKWQRKLIKTLLDFSKEKRIQFIFSTHSFEILSAYKENVSQLIDTNADKKEIE